MTKPLKQLFEASPTRLFPINKVIPFYSLHAVCLNNSEQYPDAYASARQCTRRKWMCVGGTPILSAPLSVLIIMRKARQIQFYFQDPSKNLGPHSRASAADKHLLERWSCWPIFFSEMFCSAIHGRIPTNKFCVFSLYHRGSSFDNDEVYFVVSLLSFHFLEYNCLITAQIPLLKLFNIWHCCLFSIRNVSVVLLEGLMQLLKKVLRSRTQSLTMVWCLLECV